MSTLNLTLSPQLARRLWFESSSNCFDVIQQRYETLEPTETRSWAEFSGGSMLWSQTMSDALMLLAFERAEGKSSLLLWDCFQEKPVVLTSRQWDFENGGPTGW